MVKNGKYVQKWQKLSKMVIKKWQKWSKAVTIGKNGQNWQKKWQNLAKKGQNCPMIRCGSHGHSTQRREERSQEV